MWELVLAKPNENRQYENRDLWKIKVDHPTLQSSDISATAR